MHISNNATMVNSMYPCGLMCREIVSGYVALEGKYHFAHLPAMYNALIFSWACCRICCSVFEFLPIRWERNCGVVDTRICQLEHGSGRKDLGSRQKYCGKDVLSCQSLRVSWSEENSLT